MIKLCGLSDCSAKSANGTIAFLLSKEHHMPDAIVVGNTDTIFESTSKDDELTQRFAYMANSQSNSWHKLRRPQLFDDMSISVVMLCLVCLLFWHLDALFFLRVLPFWV